MLNSTPYVDISPVIIQFLMFSTHTCQNKKGDTNEIWNYQESCAWMKFCQKKMEHLTNLHITWSIETAKRKNNPFLLSPAVIGLVWMVEITIISSHKELFFGTSHQRKFHVDHKIHNVSVLDQRHFSFSSF